MISIYRQKLMAQYSVIPAGSVVIITKASTISSSFGYVTSNMLGMHCSLRYLIYLWVRRGILSLASRYKRQMFRNKREDSVF